MNWLRNLRRSRRMQRDLAEEIQSHIDERACDLIDAGIPPADARLRARREFGNPTRIAEQGHDIWTWLWLENLWRDLRYTLRTLRRSPGFTAVAVLSLALGIGGNTAVFSLLDAIMLKTLPVAQPEQLRILTWARDPAVPLTNHSGYGAIDARTGRRVSGSFSYPAFVAFRDHVPLFSGFAGFAHSPFTVTARAVTDFASGEFVTGGYFTVLRAAPLLGRPILPADDGPSQPPVAVLTWRYWQQRFQADPAVVGSTIAINRRPTTVIGVMPPEFQGLGAGASPDFFVPISLVDAGDQVWYSRSDPGNWWVQIFARLRPGVSEDAAAAALTATLGRQIESFAPNVKPAGKPLVLLATGARGVGNMRRQFTTSLYVLGGTVCLVLLIACANLANLLLARAAARQREIAIRLSIGAGRGRLLRQFLTESLLLSALGGLAGLALASPLAAFLLRTQNPGTALGFDVRIDSRALLFTFAVSLGTGLLFGILPAMRATGTSLAAAIRSSGPGASQSGSRLRLSRVLIGAQVAFSLVLLVGAALFTRTLAGLASLDLGFRPQNLLTFQTDATRSGYKGQSLAGLYERLRARIAEVPGVESVAASQHGLIQDVESDSAMYVPGVPTDPDKDYTMIMRCTDSFLSTVGIPLHLGRDLAPSDGPGAPLVAVVNESFRRQFLPDGNPVGRIFYLGDGSRRAPNDPVIQVVGVAADAHYAAVRDQPAPTIYTPYLQNIPGLHQMTFVIRTALPPLSLAPGVRRAANSIDPQIPIAEVRTEEQQIRDTLGTERLFASLVTFFGLLAALLASMGLYGVLAYSVARRTSEIGIRMALGASRPSVQWLVLRGSLFTVLCGIAVGVPAARLLGRVARSLLFGITPADTASFVAAAVAMLAVTAAASWIPVRRAMRIQPTNALRYE